jgi:hypothetical protein
VDERTFDRLVRSISEELVGRRGEPAPRTEAEGFYLVDGWRVRPQERQHFLEFYTSHVADVIKEMSGFRQCRVTVSAIESSYSWHVQAFYEFESDAILDRFRDEFDRSIRRKFPGYMLDKVLDDMGQWVLAHEAGALVEVYR